MRIEFVQAAAGADIADAGWTVAFGANGLLIVTAADGTSISMILDPEVAALLKGRESEIAELLRQDPGLNREPDRLAELLGNMADSGPDARPADELVPAGDAEPEAGQVAPDFVSPRASGQFQTPFDVGDLGRGLGHLPGLEEDGRDDANHIVLDNVGLRSHFNTLAEFQNTGFDGRTGVGAAFDHLLPMGDDYRWSFAFGGEDGLDFPQSQGTTPPRLSVPEDELYTIDEEGTVTGNLLDNDDLPNGFTGLKVKTEPSVGTLAVKPNGDFTYDPPPHFSGTVSFVYTFSDPATGQIHKSTATIIVEAVADRPEIAGPAQPYVTDEDTSVALVGLGGRLVDRDGSEVVSYRIEKVPAGTVLTDASGRPVGKDLGGGVWVFTKAELEAGPVLTPPPDIHGSIPLVLVAVATEKSNDDQAESRKPFVVVVNPVPDPVTIDPETPTLEDQPAAFGAGIATGLSKGDASDGSEHYTGATIAGIPPGSIIDLGTPTPGVDAVYESLTGTITLTVLPGATDQDFRDALAKLQLTPPDDSDADIPLVVTVTTDDAGTAGAFVLAHTITVAAFADPPTADFSGGPNVQTDPGSGDLFVEGVEDTNLPVPIVIGLTDIDGSESLERVVIEGLPAGYAFQGLIAEPDGSYILTGTLAAVQAVLAALVIVPPANADDDFTLTVTVVSRETDPTITGGDTGEIAVPAAATVLQVPVVFRAAYDMPVVTGDSTVVEDQTVNFGNNIVITRDDASDGSESITQIVVQGFPAGSSAGYPGDGVLSSVPGTIITVTADGSGNPILTIERTPTGTEADLLAALHALTVTPPADSDRDFTLSVDVTTKDNDGVTHAASGTHAVAVRAEADPATLSIPAPNSGNEDQPIAIAFSVARTDTDPTQATGSEAIETVVIRNIPSGFTLSSTSGAATLALNPDGSYTVTGPSLADPVANDAAVNDVLAQLVLTPAGGGARTHVDDDFWLDVDVTTIETILDGGQIATERNTQNFTVPVTVDAIADAVSISGASTVVEDHDAGFGANIGLTHADLNASLTLGPTSETITKIIVAGIPAGATLGIGTPTSNVVVDTSIAGEISLTLQSGGNEADIRAALDKLTLTPPDDSDADFTLTLDVTTVDRWDTAEASAPVTTTGLTHTITVIADAVGDEPSISGTASGSEDTAFDLPITVTLGDTDGSEILDKVTITGLPVGAVIAWTPADLPAGVTATAIMSGADIVGWTFDQTSTTYATTQALQGFLASKLSIAPPPQSAADFSLTVEAFNYESNLSGGGGRTSATPSTVASVVVTVTPVLDGVVLGASSTLVNEDEHQAPSGSDGTAPFVTLVPGSVVFGDDIEAVLTRAADTGEFDAADRSEGISQIVLSGFPAGGLVSWTDQAGVVVTQSPAGTFTIAIDAGSPPADPAALEESIRDVLKTFEFGAPDHDATDVAVAVSVTRQDVDPDTGAVLSSVAAAGSHQIVVNAVADAPIVSGDSETTREDIAVHLDSLSTVLRDTDGSETLTVQINGVDPDVRLTDALDAEYSFVLVGDGTKTYSIAPSSLGNVYFHPPSQEHGTYAMTIVATATETAVPGEASTDDVASVQAPITVIVTPVVDAVAANNSGSIVDENGTFALGANILESPTDADVASDMSLADLDGSQNLTIVITGFPAGTTGFVNPSYTLPAGVSANFDAGAGTFTLSGAAAAGVLAALAEVRSTVTEDGDANFDLTVTATTDENSPVSEAGDYQSQTTVINHHVQVQAVADAPALDVGTATKAVVTEDSGFVTYPVATGLNDTDGSETYQSVVVSFSTGGSGAQPSAQLGTTAGVTVDTSVAGQMTLTGAAADIDAAMATLQVRPGAHNDADITVTIRVRVVESNPTEVNDNGPGVAGNEITTPVAQSIASFVIPVAAVADAATLTGSGSGHEDQNIPVSITVGHPDNADGSERIRNVVIANVPAGLTLTESSTGAGTLTLNLDGTYTATGPTDAAINDVLANLTLVFVPGGARQHLDTDFNLSVTVTTREFTPSESGIGQVDTLESSAAFNVPITVTAVVDGVTGSGASTIVEDTAATIGPNIAHSHIDADGSESVTAVVVSGFPVDSVVAYADVLGNPQTFVSTGTETVTLSGGSAAQIRVALDTLQIQAPPQSDANFSLTVAVTTADNDASTTTNTFSHAVTVQAVADAPSVAADDLATSEDTAAALFINPNRSADDDNSESLSVRITVPSDGSGAVGVLSGSPAAGVTFTNVGGGVYTVTSTGATPALREAALDTYLNGGVTFAPRPQWSGVLTGTSGIRVEVISTEAAVGTEVAPGSYGGPDGTSKSETATTYIDVTIAPVNDLPVLVNTSTLVRENANSSNPSDPNLVIAMGARLGLTIADTDGSQGLSMTLTGFPANAQALAFATSISGVNTTIDIPTGTITINGVSANAVLTVLASLSITLADDDDANFTVAINGASIDSNGVTIDSDAFSLIHNVVVQAVADTPALNVGAATKPAVDEDSGFVSYPVTVGLNDTDGSESFQSVVVQYATPGAGNPPDLQFTTTAGVTFDMSVAGRITLTGPAADIAAAMASLEVRPGADNGEDITITVTVTSIESNPTEPSDNGPGVTGSEISIPTAQSVRSFVIPVTPVPETPGLTLPANPSGTEDVTFALGTIVVSSGTNDPDGSEQLYIEIDVSSFPPGTIFSSGGAPVGSVVTAGWLRIPTSALADLSIRGPGNYSGTMSLGIRGVVVDTSTSDAITTVTTVQTLVAAVAPVADSIATAAASVGVEDNGAVAFGADLASTLTGIRVADNTSGTGNNAASETLSRIVLDFPADTAMLTYTILTGAVVGTAAVAFDVVTRTYTITSSIITGAVDAGALSQASRFQAEADIRATLAGFTVTIGPDHTDFDGVVAVTATTLDVNNGVYDTRDNTFNHTILIQAVADTPAISVVDPVVSTTEDGPNVALTIDVGNSADTDNSETLSVRITVPSDALGPVGTISGTPPAGVTLTGMGGGVFLVTATGADNAAREALLDSFLDGGGIAFDPRANWSGNLTGIFGLKVEAISTEAATGGQLAPGSFGGSDGTSATETVVDYIDILVTPVVDAPIVKANGVGVEDQLIPVPNSISRTDTDGSETYAVRITAVLPAGTKVHGAGGAEVLPDGSGHFNLSQNDLVALAVKPPLHYSSMVGGDITLTFETTITDTTSGGVAVQSFTQDVFVAVSGVADQPGTRTIDVTVDEDQPITLGAAILTSTSGNLNNLLVDTDGSELLSFVLSGLPQGVIPTTSDPAGGLTYLGGGTWSVTAAAMATLTLPTIANFSGENPYSGIRLRAVTQELDGDQASSPDWPVTIKVNPIINAATVDGLSGWTPGMSQSEAVSEATGVSLAAVASHGYVDSDGSESVVSYTFNLSGLIADAGIAGRLAALPGTGTGLDKLVGSYVSGTFTYDAGAGTITVLSGNIGGIILSPLLFLDSNEDFTIPVSALVRDAAVIDGTPVNVDKTETGMFTVDLAGTADVPTAFASAASGNSGTELPVSLGGVSTDTDVGLGRVLSEDIYYIVSVLNPGTAPALGFTDGNGNIVGLDNGDGTWLLTPSELVNLHVTTPPGSVGVANMRITTIATENDGDTASNTASFDVTVTAAGGGGGGTPPLPPTVTIGTNSGNEDGSITLNVTAAPAPGDPTNPTVAVMISDLPVGAEVIGARFNPDTGRWVASASAVNAGLVTIIPPDDFSGTMSITIEAVAVNASLQKATTGAQYVPVDVDPVADGVTISAIPASGAEDTVIDLNVALGERDVDGSEEIGSFTYLTLSDGATLVGAYAIVTAGDADQTVDGTSLVGYYRVPTADVPGLQMLPAANWHGSVTVTVAAYAVEPADDNDGDSIHLDTSSFGVTVIADADPPIITVPVSVSGVEDASIALPGLSAALADSVTTNGPEILSAKISGAPSGSLFSAGSNNGDGSWTIPLSALATLQIRPPLHYSGTMTLTLTAIALEVANGDDGFSSLSFDVVVEPKADSVEILARDVVVDNAGEVALDLNIRMADDRGSTPGEDPAETIEITFSSIPEGITLTAASGGSFANGPGGTRIFSGTETEANGIVAVVGPTAIAGTYSLSLSAVTVDGTDTLATPVSDSFQITIPNVVTGTSFDNSLTGTTLTDLMWGLAGNDTLVGGAGDDRLTGGTGTDTLDGGSGSDTYAWLAGDTTGAPDHIVGGFDGATMPNAGGDIIDISQLLPGYVEGTSDIADFVQLSESGGDTTIRIDSSGAGNFVSGVDVVTIEGVTGLDLNQMKAQGNMSV